MKPYKGSSSVIRGLLTNFDWSVDSPAHGKITVKKRVHQRNYQVNIGSREQADDIGSLFSGKTVNCWIKDEILSWWLEDLKICQCTVLVEVPEALEIYPFHFRTTYRYSKKSSSGIDHGYSWITKEKKIIRPNRATGPKKTKIHCGSWCSLLYKNQWHQHYIEENTKETNTTYDVLHYFWQGKHGGNKLDHMNHKEMNVWRAQSTIY